MPRYRIQQLLESTDYECVILGLALAKSLDNIDSAIIYNNLKERLGTRIRLKNGKIVESKRWRKNHK